MKSKITIIISCYNHQLFLKKCLTSILNQKKNKLPKNIIFIDDKSTDNSLKIASKFLNKFKNVKIIKNRKNLGLTKSCNKAIKACKTEYFIRVDSDDYISKDFINSFEKIIFKKKYDLISCKRIEFNNNNKKKISIDKKKIDLFKFVSCGVALKTNKVKRIGMYKNILWEEYDLYIRYLKNDKFSIRIIDKYLYYYRKHKKSMSYKKNWLKKAWEQLINKYGNNKLVKYGKLPKNL